MTGTLIEIVPVGLSSAVKHSALRSHSGDNLPSLDVVSHKFSNCLLRPRAI